MGRRFGAILCALLVTTLMVAALGCGEEAARRRRAPRAAADPSWRVPAVSDPAWSAPVDPGAAVVARVDGAPIYMSDVLSVLEAHPDWAPELAVERLVEFELLALRAAAEPDLDWAKVSRTGKRRGVQRMLRDRFVDGHGPADVSRADLERAFSHPSVRLHYQHHDAYTFMDAQIVCCEGDWRLCDRDAEVRSCLEERGEEAATLWSRLTARGPFGDREDLTRAIEDLRGDYPDVRIAEFTFWYQEGVPYSDQRGYDKLYEPLVDEVRPGAMGIALGPVRSPHAWHVPVKLRHRPAQHRTLDDPEVRDEIIENIYPAIQRRDYLQLQVGLEQAAPLRVEQELLAQLLLADSEADGEPLD